MKKEIWKNFNYYGIPAKYLICVICIFLALIVSGRVASAVQHNSANEIVQSGSNSYPSDLKKSYSTNLSFEDRVACQKAIEKVYWNYRLWPKENHYPKPAFDSLGIEEEIKQKTEDVLRKSNALEQLWKRPISSAQLQAEMERMAKHTKKSEILKDVWQSLHNDPRLIAECFVRPILVERFMRNWYSSDSKIHGSLKEKILSELSTYSNAGQIRLLSGEYSEINFIRQDAIHQSPNKAEMNSHEKQIYLNMDEWNSMMNKLTGIFRQSYPGSHAIKNSRGTAEIDTSSIPIGIISSLQENENSFQVMTILSMASNELRIAVVAWKKIPFEKWWAESKNSYSAEIHEPSYSYNVPSIVDSICEIDSWTPTAGAPEARWGHTAVWTGTEMIIWGGTNTYDLFYLLNSGAKYNPGTDTWVHISLVNTPPHRYYHTAVWTGTEMIIWGGLGENSIYFNLGGRYNPVSNSWTNVATTNAPEGRNKHTAVWTGTEMIVWGGSNGTSFFNSGGRYNPGNDTWLTTSTSNAPAARDSHVAGWTGSQMILWGGYDGTYLNSGSRYNPGSDSWNETNVDNGIAGRTQHTAVWTGNYFIIWGGYNSGTYLNSGSRYNPVSDTWELTSPTNVPDARGGHTAVWTGTRMLIWGGNAYEGGIYNPGSDAWTHLSGTNPPYGRAFHTAVWTGTEMIIWGGDGPTNTGGRYNPVTDSWVATSLGNTPDTSHPTAVWTGVEMIVWGRAEWTNTSGKYNLATDSWSSNSSINSPNPRENHTAIWTGTEMIIWGGEYNTGGRYNPITDSWIATTTVNAPSWRSYHSAVWTGTEMIIWGGNGGALNNPLSDGGIYNPIQNSWNPVSNSNTLEARDSHPAVWTGTEMIIWGGRPYGYEAIDTGARYNPSQDTWTPMTINNLPTARNSHNAVWTGTDMIIWGGHNFNGTLNTGAKYNVSTNSWSPISTINAPEARNFNTAIWTGQEMIVWGGYIYNGGDHFFNSGGRYNPGTDSWLSTPTFTAPSRRRFHAAVWTGNEMIVWGGEVNSSIYDIDTDTGSRFCVCSNPQAPASLTAAPTAPNQITLNWSPVSGAAAYTIYRKHTLCGNEVDEILAQNINSTSYVDNTVSGGSTYFYRVSSISQCESSPTNWVSAIAAGECLAKPCFTGVSDVVNNQANPCSLTVQWGTAISSCADYPGISYSVYKSTNAVFIPDSTTRIASCLTGTSFVDNNVASNSTFYYIVKSEDSRTGGSGPCNGGNLDDNQIKKSNFPTAGPVSVLFNDDFASPDNWLTGRFWGLTGTYYNSSPYSIWSGNNNKVQCDALKKKISVSLPSGTAPKLHFWTRYYIENGFNAGIVEGSTNDTDWIKLALTPDYPSVTNTSAQLCLGVNPQPAFTGRTTVFNEYISDLTAFEGMNFTARFSYATNTTVANNGWHIDDVRIDAGPKCMNGSPDCTTAPSFPGLLSATSGTSSFCVVNLSWSPGTSTCLSGTSIKYHIYRSIDPDFVPSSANRIASCIEGNTYHDTTTLYGTTYYYMVRAEDSTNNGNGPCNNGNSDTNLIKKKVSVTGPLVNGFADDFEAGLSNWSVSANWNWNTTQSHSPSHSAHSGYVTYQCDTLTLVNFLSPPAGSYPRLSFWTYHNILIGWGGGIVQASSDGISWTKIILKTNYPANCGNSACIGSSQDCFSSSSGGTWKQYQADLMNYASGNLKIRYIYTTNGSGTYGGWFANNGWYIDDVAISWGSACTFGGTAPGTVPDNDNFPGIPLTLAKSGINLILNWGAPSGPCITQDYGIYQGTLPWTGYNHIPVICITGGSTTASVVSGNDSYYFLVAAQNNAYEGSYGLDSFNIQRPASSSPCFPQQIGVCN